MSDRSRLLEMFWADGRDYILVAVVTEGEDRPRPINFLPGDTFSFTWADRPGLELTLDFRGPLDPDQVALGAAPRPETTWQTFWHHVAHGLLMRYPLLEVLWFSWWHRHSWRRP